MDEWMDSGWVHKQGRTNYMVSVTLFVSSPGGGENERVNIVDEIRESKASGRTHFVQFPILYPLLTPFGLSTLFA